jgi:glycerophosphoryl diester phosphodiesterase
VELTADEIECFDVGRARPGSVYAHKHPEMLPADGERIPLLAEVIALARRAAKPFRLFIELKSSLADSSLSVQPEMLADATIAILKQMDFIGRSVLVGFDWRGLLRAKEVESACACWFSTRPQGWFRDGVPPTEDDPPPSAALLMLRYWAEAGASPWAAGFDANKFGGSVIDAIKAAGGDGWFPWWRDATPDAIAQAHACGLEVGAWTVNDPAAIYALTDAGIDAICTDRPDLMV